ncbi:hypothetical protein PU560_08935, partial [Georgenia sp. 10Sc9-8]|nr:hypothetical protein [Georgenia halotolerans]
MNIRHAAGTAAAAAALVLAPTAAVADTYEQPDEDLTVSDATPAPGQSFEVYVDGEDDEVTAITLTVSNPDVPDTDITIAGVQSLEKAADEDGDATFTVTLASPGAYSLVSEDQDGNGIDSATVVVEGAVEDEDDAAEQPGTGTDEDGNPAEEP